MPPTGRVNRRIHPRFHVFGTQVISPIGDVHVEDLSRTGMRVEITATGPIAEDDHYFFALYHGNHGIELDGRIRWWKRLEQTADNLSPRYEAGVVFDEVFTAHPEGLWARIGPSSRRSVRS